jgi:hypothetical protein
VNENAFAPIVRARPCPTFGRPVHRRGSPHRLRPGTSPHTLRIPPHGGHPVLRSNAESSFRFTLAVSSFRFRARLGFSIPSLFPGQRGVTPAFGYSAPHLSAGGTSTLPNNALLSAHYGVVRLLTFHPCPLRLSLGCTYLPTLQRRSSWCGRRWGALVSSWAIPLETCPGLGTPASARPRNNGRCRILPSARLTASASQRERFRS